MKVRRITIGIRHPDASLREAKEVARRIQAGKKLPEREEELYFADVETLRKALSPKRLVLLWAIAEHAPRSVRELAERIGRDIKNVSQDLAFLSRLGLVELKEGRRGAPQAPVLPYDEIDLNLRIRPSHH
jgi:predicted transcriptional regulator